LRHDLREKGLCVRFRTACVFVLRASIENVRERSPRHFKTKRITQYL
jgi:hypothetical protein